MKSGLKAMTTMFSRFESLGTKAMPNGTVLYGKAPHVGEQAWLHELYPPCPEAGLATIEEEVDASLPASLRKLLLLANGLEVFSGVLSLYGRREDFKRTMEAVLSQPYSIVTPNTRERPEWLPRESWIVGSYGMLSIFVIAALIVFETSCESRPPPPLRRAPQPASMNTRPVGHHQRALFVSYVYRVSQGLRAFA